jgi:tetratricopeptide (TPR) repeat protein
MTQAANPPTGMHALLPAATLAAMQALYDDGQLLKALRLGEEIAPIRSWRGIQERILGGRIAWNLGAPRLSRAMHIQAFRCDREDPGAIYYYARARWERNGPLAALSFCKRIGELVGADPELRCDWLAMRANLAASYRDFEAADDLIDQAVKVSPRRPWLCVERARVLELEDRCEEALAAARESLEIQPWFRSGVHAMAHLLQMLDRDHEALALLIEASQRIESAALIWQLASLQDDLQMHADAQATMSRMEEFGPLKEKRYGQGVDASRSNIAHHAADYSGAIKFARLADNEFMRSVADKLQAQMDAGLRDGQSGVRTQLELPFIRQHHMTCAPATMAMIARFWNRPADHLAVVDAICYDGTPAHSQRKWAVSNDWVVREFTVTWESAVNLIERGLPFGLTTSQVASAHLQAVVGFDTLRNTLLCRDPSRYYTSEISFDLLIKHNSATGPRGMLMLPGEQAQLLDGIVLPDADLFDILHEIEAALARHDREAADSGRQKLIAAAPEHRLTLHAQRALAAYDSDGSGLLQAIDGLIAKYPDDQALLYSRIYALRSLERHDLILPLLEKRCGEKGTDPNFYRLYAEELRSDVGDNAQVISLLKRALRLRPTDAASLFGLANALWSAHDLDESTGLYRLCACVDEMNETGSQSYFIASRHLRQTQTAMTMLRRRFDRLGKRSGRPARTLFWAFELLDRVPEGIAVLERAMELRPDDGDLLLYASVNLARHGDMVRGEALLARAAEKTHRTAWLRGAAQIAAYQAEHKKALDLWRQVLDAEPLANDANSQVARLIAETDSPAAATAHLSEMHRRFPYHTGLQQIRILHLRSAGPAAVEPVARELVASAPGNIWARVELALALTQLGRASEALEHANAAVHISPHAPNAHYAVGNALRRLDRLDEAREAFRTALRSSIDAGAAMTDLVDSYPDAAGKREALAFLRGELERQVTFGQGLLSYRAVAAAVLEPAEILVVLRQALAARPDLWQAWSVLVYELCEANQLDDALAMAKDATERFPLLPRTWFDVSHVCGLRGDRPGQIAALKTCLQLSPNWSMASQRLARALQLSGDRPAAVAVLQKAIARDPLDAENHDALARLHWACGERAEAVASGRRGVLFDPSRTGLWESLRDWTGRMKEGEAELVELARQICQNRGGEAIAWIVLAQTLRGEKTMPQRLEACERAISLSPRNADAHDLKAFLLLQNKQPKEALAACDPAEFAGAPPISLRGRAAWIHAQRGETDVAIEAMRKIVTENSGYYWGWRQLMQWMFERKRHENDSLGKDFLDTATLMIGAFPHDTIARNYLASAKLAVKDREGAKQTLQKSLELTPNDFYAFGTLFDLQVEDKDFGGAERTLGLIQSHANPDYAASRGAMLAAARNDEPAAREAIAKLLSINNAAADLVSFTIGVLDKAHMGGVIDEAFADVMGKPDVRPALVEIWCGRLAEQRQFKRGREIFERFAGNPKLFQAAGVPLINGLAKAKALSLILKLMRKHQKGLREQTPLWGAIGYALFACGQPRRCIGWLKDWKDHADAQPWMLLNLANALRRSGKRAAAIEVGRAAVELKGDHTTGKHVVWLALDEVTSGAPGIYMGKLQGMDTSQLDKAFPFLLQLIRALEPLCGSGDGNPKQKSRAARKAIAEAATKTRTWVSQRELLFSLRRSIRRVPAFERSAGNFLWAGWWLVRTVPLKAAK